MSQFFDLASLVLVPSGYKSQKIYAQKPLSADGQLAFTRSNDTATRVGPDGLIEKVRTNSFIYSEDLTNAAWTKDNITISSNVIANPLDGALTADGAIATASNTYHSATRPSTVISGLINISIYVKSAAKSNLEIESLGGQVSFNLSAGTINYETGGTGTITSVGGGWYRCSVSTTVASSSYVAFLMMPTTGTSEGFTGDGSTIDMYYYGAQVESGDVATDYIATTTAAVSVGPVANLPRLDYSGGATCPKLLLEPQRTNLATYSENFDNAAWTKVGSTITANNTTSPDGYVNADKLVEDTSTGNHAVNFLHTVTTTKTFTLSVFVKPSGRTWFNLFAQQFRSTSNLNCYGWFNLDTGAVGTATSATSSITEMANGFYKCSITYTTDNNTLWVVNHLQTSDADNSNIYTGNGTSGAYIYGAQLEEGSYATSYIPTIAATTRGADKAEKTGISSLIGQAEGTLFIEANFTSGYDANNILMNLSDGVGSSNLIYINCNNGKLEFFVQTASITQMLYLTPTILSAGVHKMALGYKANDFVVYIDGVLAHTDTSGSVPACSKLNLGSYWNASLPYNNGVSQALLFPTRLTNAQLAELTTI